MIRKVSLFAAFALAATVVVAQDDDWGDDEVDEAADVVADAIHDAVDSAEAEVSLLDDHHEVVIIADVHVIEEEVIVEPLDPCEDGSGTLWIGITTCVGLVWWMLWGWFIYMPTNVADSTMNVVTGATNQSVERMLPIGWFWSNMSSTTVGWTAAMYFTTFWAYLIVSVVEFVGWILYMVNEDVLITIWSPWVGYYGSLVLYALPWIWAACQMGQLADPYRESYSNAILHMIMHMVGWIFIGVVHILFNDNMMAHLNCRAGLAKPDPCLCEAYINDVDAEFEENNIGCLAKKALCSAKLQEGQCKDNLLQWVYDNCALSAFDDEDNDQFQHRCREAHIATCGLVRDDGENDIDFIVRCKVAETNTCEEQITEVVEVIEDHHDDISDVDGDDAGDGW
jgi:hypothetical protein